MCRHLLPCFSCRIEGARRHSHALPRGPSCRVCQCKLSRAVARVTLCRTHGSRLVAAALRTPASAIAGHRRDDWSVAEPPSTAEAPGARPSDKIGVRAGLLPEQRQKCRPCWARAANLSGCLAAGPISFRIPAGRRLIELLAPKQQPRGAPHEAAICHHRRCSSARSRDLSAIRPRSSARGRDLSSPPPYLCTRAQSVSTTAT